MIYVHSPHVIPEHCTILLQTRRTHETSMHFKRTKKKKFKKEEASQQTNKQKSHFGFQTPLSRLKF